LADEAAERLGHESLDAASRRRKARKIQAILERDRSLVGAHVLEIGVGSGHISAYLAEVVGSEGAVRGVDVRDSRVTADGYAFTLVEDAHLPFEDASFDVVLSNHVIEHVGAHRNQLVHLQEMGRVLRPTGVAYLATPNRWTLMEPHFHLPFLSWLPERARTPYVRLARKGPAYDCELLSRRALLDLVREAGLHAEDRTVEAIRLMAELEPLGPLARGYATAPDAVHRALLPVVPTAILLLSHPR
jgi:SAM-dependent methyltransferase